MEARKTFKWANPWYTDVDIIPSEEMTTLANWATKMGFMGELATGHLPASWGRDTSLGIYGYQGCSGPQGHQGAPSPYVKPDPVSHTTQVLTIRTKTTMDYSGQWILPFKDHMSGLSIGSIKSVPHLAPPKLTPEGVPEKVISSYVYAEPVFLEKFNEIAGDSDDDDYYRGKSIDRDAFFKHKGKFVPSMVTRSKDLKFDAVLLAAEYEEKVWTGKFDTTIEILPSELPKYMGVLKSIMWSNCVPVVGQTVFD